MNQEPLQYEPAKTDDSLAQVAVYVGLILFGISRLMVASNDTLSLIAYFFREKDRYGSGSIGDVKFQFLWMILQPSINIILGFFLIYFSSAIAAKCRYPSKVQIAGINFVDVMLVAVVVTGLTMLVWSVSQAFYIVNLLLITMGSIRGSVGSSNYWLSVLSPSLQILMGTFFILRPGWIVGKILRYSRLDVPEGR